MYKKLILAALGGVLLSTPAVAKNPLFEHVFTADAAALGPGSGQDVR